MIKPQAGAEDEDRRLPPGHPRSLALIEAAVAHARASGAPAVEAYPTVVRGDEPLTTISTFMGTPEMFAKSGFAECARRSASRMIMRRGFGGR
ncbi:hypothetical protein H8E07_07445 [bacterium]|nr:hypothetical protein [bacterium]